MPAATRAELAAQLAAAKAEIAELRAGDPAKAADALEAVVERLDAIEEALTSGASLEPENPVHSYVVTNKPFVSAWGVHQPGETIYEHMIADGSSGLGAKRLIRLERLAEGPVVDASDIPADLATPPADVAVDEEPTGSNIAEVTAAAAVAAAGSDDYLDGSRAPGQPDGEDGSAADPTGIVTLTDTGSTVPQGA